MIQPRHCQCSLRVLQTINGAAQDQGNVRSRILEFDLDLKNGVRKPGDVLEDFVVD
jgi:hypothetical protein